ncbi:MAG: hypothetical protein JKX84_09720 [Flavobacteriales bacterium]|nr:hypothetical protein [Flavobacteriales bacterium]
MKRIQQYLILALLCSCGVSQAQNNQYQYNNLNRLTEAEDANGTRYNFQYDELGNRTGYQITAGSNAEPDLTFQSQSVVPSTIQAGTAATVNYTVQNIGTATSGGYYTKVFLSNDGTTMQTELASSYAANLGVGNTASQSESVTIPGSTTVGPWFLILFADATDVNTESDETNNTTVLSITVTAPPPLPDLVVQNAAASGSTVTAGDALTLTANVSNTGTGNATAHQFRCYLSANAIFEAFLDAELPNGAVSIGALNSGSSSAVNVTVTIPANTLAGNYNLLLYTDADEEISETDDQNNIASLALL